MIFKFCLFFVFAFINLMNFCDSNIFYDEIVRYNDDDIKDLSYKDQFNLHHAFVIEKFKWQSGLISFKIDRTFNDDEIRDILSAMYEIERSSCIRFAAHNPINGPNYVMILKQLDFQECGYAVVGCGNIGEQELRINTITECNHTVLHELLHTIGFNHHHKRSDRDDYIDIDREICNCTDEDFLANYAKEIKYDARIKYLTPFDYNSVMLYDEPEIASIIEGVEVKPSKDKLSKYDKVLLNRFYDCDSVYKTKSVIFYEDEFGIDPKPIINYHEIKRAQQYLFTNEVYKTKDNGEYELTDIGDEGAVNESILLQNNNSTDEVYEANVDDDQAVVIESEQLQNNSSTSVLGHDEYFPDDTENFVVDHDDEEVVTKGMINEERININENYIADQN